MITFSITTPPDYVSCDCAFEDMHLQITHILIVSPLREYTRHPAPLHYGCIHMWETMANSDANHPKSMRKSVCVCVCVLNVCVHIAYPSNLSNQCMSASPEALWKKKK